MQLTQFLFSRCHVLAPPKKCLKIWILFVLTLALAREPPARPHHTSTAPAPCDPGPVIRGLPCLKELHTLNCDCDTTNRPDIIHKYHHRSIKVTYQTEHGQLFIAYHLSIATIFSVKLYVVLQRILVQSFENIYPSKFLITCQK